MARKATTAAKSSKATKGRAKGAKTYRVSFEALRKPLKTKIATLTKIKKSGTSSAKLNKTLTLMEDLLEITECQTTMTISYP